MNDPANVVTPPSPTVASEEVAALSELLDQFNSVVFKELGLDKFKNRTRKYVRLIGNKDPLLYLTSKDDWFSFDLEELIYVDSIEILLDRESDGDDFTVSYIDSFTKDEKKISVPAIQGKVQFRIGRFLQGFGIRTPWKFWKQAKITSFRVYGLNHLELTELVGAFKQVDQARENVLGVTHRQIKLAEDAKAELEKVRADINAKQDEEDELQIQISATKSELVNWENQRSAKEEAVAKLVASVQAKERNVVDLEDLLEKKLSERKSINDEVTAASTKLAELENNIHLFPSEIAGYVKQGTRNAWLYAALSVFPILIICGVTYKLFSNSEQLLNVFLLPNRPPIGEYLLSRLPYTLVQAIVLAVCYAILHRFFSEIVAINRQKQDLFKISIVATDVAYASNVGLGIDRETEYHLRTQTKMELLREHLKQHLSTDYVYGGSSGPIHALLEAFRKRVDLKDDAPVAAEQSPKAQGKED